MSHKNALHSRIQKIQKQDSSFGGRFWVVVIFFVFIALAIIIQLFRLQVVFAKKYTQKAENQYVDTSTSLFDRGSIYFTRKDGTLLSAATVSTGFKVAVNPSLVKNADEVYQALEPYTDIPKEDFIKKITKEHSTYVEVAFKLTDLEAKDIKDKKIQGVYLYPQSWRKYPGGRLASQVLGFIGFKGDVVSGQYGLEREYDDVLATSSGSGIVNFFAEIFSNIKTDTVQDNRKIGNLVTTIEPIVQAYLEKSLSNLKKEWGSEQVGGVIMDPKNGEIIALANMPDFDPNSFNTEKSPKVFSNPIVESVFEPGSVMKTVTMSIGLDTHAINPDTHYTDRGIVELDTEKIYNAGKKSYGYVSMQDVLNKSLNTGATFVMQQVGKNVFRDYLYKFNINKKTDVDLPNEVSNMVKNLESPRDVEYATASFGQGIALTPISAVRTFAVLANGGYLVTPHIVKKIQYSDGTEKELTYEKGAQVISKDTTDRLSRMLVTVVDRGLLGGTVKLAHHTAAAKTGTAQIVGPNGQYYDNLYLHTMMSFFPAYDARYVMFVYNLKPNADEFSARTLGPMSMDIGQFLMTYYNVPGDR